MHTMSHKEDDEGRGKCGEIGKTKFTHCLINYLSMTTKDMTKDMTKVTVGRVTVKLLQKKHSQNSSTLDRLEEWQIKNENETIHHLPRLSVSN